MRAQARFLVPGEELPPIVATAVSLVGIASAAGALVAWMHAVGVGTTSTTPTPTPIVSAQPPVPVPVPVPVASVSAPTTPSASASVPGRPKCPPLVVGFNTESVYPSHSANPPLARLAKWLVAHPAATIVVDGHADATGSDDKNLRLSRQRAAFIGATLEAAGAPKARVTVRAFGSYWPADETPPNASWNRRVVVQTKGEECPLEKEEVIEP